MYNRQMSTVYDLSSMEFNKYMNVLSEYLTQLYIRLGRPEADINNNSFWVMIDELVNDWSIVHKEEAKEFTDTIKIDRAAEMTLGALVKANSWKKSVAYPPSLYKMIKIFFPDLKLQDRKFIEKFINRYPIFNASNYT